LPNEAAGKILDQYPINKLTTSYGQGSTVTPIQMIQAATAIAGDGTMMKPYIIDQIKNPDTGDVTVKSEPEQAGTPISADTAKKVREIMASTVTSEVGSAQGFALQDYSVAGKTGTAQVPGEGGRYMSGTNNYLFSFLGMAPAEDPELLIYIGVQQPQLPADEYGSVPVSKIFTSVMENGLKYLNIAPENSVEAKTVEIEDYKGLPMEEAVSQLKAKGLNPVIAGDNSQISDQYPKAGEKLVAGENIILRTGGTTAIPDFTGWSKRELLAFQALSGLPLEIAGQGFAMTQSVAEGAVPESGESVIIELQPPEVFYPEQSLKAEEAQQPGTEPAGTEGQEATEPPTESITEEATEETTETTEEQTEQPVNNENE